MTKITTAMLLAAGLGTRMKPLTDTRPKPLVEVGGRALVDRVLDKLVIQGVTRAVVNVHHFADQMTAHLAKRKDIEIIISDERDVLLETGINISPLPVWVDEWDHPETYSNPRLLQNIAAEGVSL